MLENYAKSSFTAPLRSGQPVTHDIYTRGQQSATVVIIQELPGIGPETLALADRLYEAGFRIVLPHLFGPLGKVSMLGNFVRVLCMRREFHLFEKNRSSPVVDWLKALCRHLRDSQGAERIGVIGMCLTGNFAISLIADDAVLAAVASQPSLPFNGQHCLALSEEEIEAVRRKLDPGPPMLALRFTGDKFCNAEKFKAIEQTFNDDRERVHLVNVPGEGHSVLTLDFNKGGEPAEKALLQVIGYFREQLA